MATTHRIYYKRNMKTYTIHGNGQDSHIFKNLGIPDLINLTLPGHGDQKCIGEYSINRYADFVSSIIGQDECILLGHSLGGHIALEVATRLNKVKALISIGAPPLVLENNSCEYIQDESFNVLYQESPIDDLLNRFISRCTVTKKFNNYLKDTFALQSPLARTTFIKSIIECGIDNEKIKLQGLKIPKLFIYGKDENIVNLDYVKSLDEITPFFITGGHNIMLDNPSSLEKLISDFIEKI
jgi:pimeloyl-ACP methyl ester carboxylesterase